jgi:hypothetical protein
LKGIIAGKSYLRGPIQRSTGEFDMTYRFLDRESRLVIFPGEKLPS